MTSVAGAGPHPRILYWFRTPPGVRVGRAALDEDAIRLIEQSNPGIEFDWTRILKAQEPVQEQRAPFQHERRARPRTREFSPRDVAPPLAVLPPPIAQPRLDAEPDRARTPEVTNTAVVLPFPQPIATTEVPPARHEASAAAVRLGPEGLSRLRARHAEILARVDEKIADPVRREQLKGDAERLNPDTWVTDAEVTAGTRIVRNGVRDLEVCHRPAQKKTPASYVRRGGRRRRRSRASRRTRLLPSIGFERRRRPG